MSFNPNLNENKNEDNENNNKKRKSEKSHLSIIDKNEENEYNYVDASVSNANLITEINKNLSPQKRYTDDCFEDCNYEEINTKNFSNENFSNKNLKNLNENSNKKNTNFRKSSNLLNSNIGKKNSINIIDLLKNTNLSLNPNQEKLKSERFNKQKASEIKIQKEILLLMDQIKIKNTEEIKSSNNNNNKEGKFFSTSYNFNANTNGNGNGFKEANRNINNENKFFFGNYKLDKINFNKTTGENLGFLNQNQLNNDNNLKYKTTNNFYREKKDNLINNNINNYNNYKVNKKDNETLTENKNNKLKKLEMNLQYLQENININNKNNLNNLNIKNDNKDNNNTTESNGNLLSENKAFSPVLFSNKKFEFISSNINDRKFAATTYNNKENDSHTILSKIPSKKINMNFLKHPGLVKGSQIKRNFETLSDTSSNDARNNIYDFNLRKTYHAKMREREKNNAVNFIASKDYVKEKDKDKYKHKEKNYNNRILKRLKEYENLDKNNNNNYIININYKKDSNTDYDKEYDSLSLINIGKENEDYENNNDNDKEKWDNRYDNNNKEKFNSHKKNPSKNKYKNQSQSNSQSEKFIKTSEKFFIKSKENNFPLEETKRKYLSSSKNSNNFSEKFKYNTEIKNIKRGKKKSLGSINCNFGKKDLFIHPIKKDSVKEILKEKQKKENLHILENNEKFKMILALSKNKDNLTQSQIKNNNVNDNKDKHKNKDFLINLNNIISPEIKKEKGFFYINEEKQKMDIYKLKKIKNLGMFDDLNPFKADEKLDTKYGVFKKLNDLKDLKRKDMLNIPYLKKNTYGFFNYLIDDKKSFTIERTKNETFYKQYQ
jgi:hypothetical protein